MKQSRLALVVFASLALAACGFAQERPPTPPLITVSGNGISRFDPDVATVRLGIQAQGRTAREVQSQASGTAQKILDAVAKLGIDKKQIQTSTLSLYPVFSEPKPGQTTAPSIVGYRAQNTVSVRVVDLMKVGPVVDATIAAGANEVQGIEFGLRDDLTARKSALRAAVLEARGKAEAIAEALGVKLGDVYEVNEGGIQVMPLMMGRAMAADAVATPVSPGQIDVSATVTIRFRFTK
ncbi:SIMPL domain-containing protein [Fimbriimonas ginsengisoli]|uniref:Outer membrane protein, 28Kda n=1 Tax=Fimbriimonas ginsengisoli Gsoil 348 TaxID=661478 RepID=A0A068NS02_FIMGI|nr:SIMPL domain-containing protein [Fimbriimonas ginsengisoli]AIE86102.1 outer membrane protein, 28Kda [Fimbriimonas ginsengisoli Gsoil 348]